MLRLFQHARRNANEKEERQNMLGLFKKILSRTETQSAPPSKPAPAAAKPAAKPVAAAPRPPVAVRPVARPVAAPAAPVAVAASPAPTPPPSDSAHVQVALTSIAAGLPEAISHKVPAHPEQFVAIPVALVLPQLAEGHVVMTAAELRVCAPEYFSALTGHEDVAVTLPLGEIVKQLSSDHFARRQQRRIEVPGTVLPVFSPDGKGISISKPSAPAAAPAARPQPTVTTTTTPTPAAPSAPAPVAGKIAMSAEALAVLNASNGKATAPSAPTRPVGLASQPKPVTPGAAPLPRVTPVAGSGSQAASLPRPAAPAPKKPAKLSGNLAIPLASVCDLWVEEVRRQLQEVDVAQANIHAPLELIEPAMKSGKVIFSWEEVAGWIQPPLPIPPTQKVGEMPVELPLKILAPLFMAHARNGAQKRAAVDETIPDLFADTTGKANGSLQAQLPSTAPVAAPTPAAPRAVRPVAPVQAPAPASRVVAPIDPEPDVVPVSAPAVPVVQEIAIETIVGPAEKRFSVKDIVANTSRLPGLSGALLAMTDGLLVTSHAPSSVKAETIAAFLPQMFGRMNQYTKELALGPLEELTLTIESGQWHVIKSPNIYFAVLGKRGESLPLNLLAQVAAELSSQSK